VKRSVSVIANKHIHIQNVIIPLSNFEKISKLAIINDYHKYFYVNQNFYIILYKTTVNITITYAWSVLIHHIIGGLTFNNILGLGFVRPMRGRYRCPHGNSLLKREI